MTATTSRTETSDEVVVEPMFSDRSLPLLIVPAAGADVGRWAEANRHWIKSALEKHGALVFRQTGIETPEAFETFVRRISPDVADFKEESSPRHQVSGNVYTATDYPANYPVQFHTEFSYSHEWPMRLFFGCLHPSDQGGETPVADTRRVYERMSARTRQHYIEKRLMYVRNYNGEAMGVSWQKAFGTTDRSIVEEHFRNHRVEFEWGAGDSLRTRQYGDAVYIHPSTGEPVWFNHGFVFNPLAIEPEELRSAIVDSYSEEEYSTNTYFGDGEKIPQEFVEEEREAYRAVSVGFRWQKGDVLLVENMLAAHARAPFKGSRRIVVAMAERQSRSHVKPVLNATAP
ncbi:MAG: putative taurine catabolism dioxygenase [Myxococcales bacterium]|nr:putative taurine catabolism dioxygenase [Myxococcales bacterium]